jgi:prophage maintenance system killer protein
VKDHPFVDGNKRIGALLFILFLVQNNYLVNKKGERKINDSALTALTLLVATSSPNQKDVMIKLIVNLINKK